MTGEGCPAPPQHRSERPFEIYWASGPSRRAVTTASPRNSFSASAPRRAGPKSSRPSGGGGSGGRGLSGAAATTRERAPLQKYAGVLPSRRAAAASHLIPDDDVELPQPEGHTQLNLDENIFHIGETLLYSKEGHTVYVKIESINLGSDGVLRLLLSPQMVTLL